MRILLIFCITLGAFDLFAQNQLTIKNRDGEIDTLVNEPFINIRNDTLTRFLITKAQTTDQCSSFGIIRELYKKEDNNFINLLTKRIVLGTKCSDLTSGDKIYCLRLTKFKLKRGIVNIVIRDSNSKVLRTKLKGDSNFEILLKEKVKEFVTDQACEAVRIE